MALAADMALLRTTPLFEELGDEELRLIAFSARKSVFRSGERVLSRGENAEGATIVVMGALETTDAEGRAETVEPGALLDELALVMPRAHGVDAVAVEDGAVMRVDRSLFLHVVEEYPRVAEVVRARIGDRLEALLASIEPVAERLASIRD